MPKEKLVKNSKDSGSELSKSKLLDMYYQMLLIRRFEEKAGQLYGMGKIAGFCHLYIGQEAVAVGAQMAMREGDQVTTSYRCHGPMVAKGADPKVILAELMGKASGCSKGKGGSMHMFDVPKRFYGGHGIVGAQVPIATGIALANKYNNTDDVSVVYYGDGAAHQGQVYEAFNMAALWDLPVLYVVENNQYAMGTSVKRSTSVTDLYKKGESCGIEGSQVDGMDVISVYNAVTEALDYIRTNKKPYILEMMTYRYRGHSMSDPAKYRSKEEVSMYKDSKDPIENLRQVLSSKYKASEEEFKEIESRIKSIVQETVDFCENSPEPDESELYTDIYKE